MAVIQFEGSRVEVDAAEAWCGPNIYEGYAIGVVAPDTYHFSFYCPFEAQRFRDAHGKNTTHVY